jgi:CHAT domain-containing protein
MGRAVIVLCLFLTAITSVNAQVAPTQIDEQLQSINDKLQQGSVKQSFEQAVALLRQIDLVKDKDAYWRVSRLLVDVLQQTENHALAAGFIDSLIATKIPETNQAYFQWMQLYISRNLAYTGKADDAIKVLRALTAGDERLVHSPPQRAAALLFSQIELDRDNIAQAAIWMRRAIIGGLADKGAGSEEIVDLLSEYANFLVRTRRLAEGSALFFQLAPFYEAQFAHTGPKYLVFQSRFLGALTAIGNFQAADLVYKTLKDSVQRVDLPPTSVREGLFFQELYQLARTPTEQRKDAVSQRLKKLVADFPDFLNGARNRIVFTYFAILAGDMALAEEFIVAPTDAEPLNDQFSAYATILRAFIEASRGNYSHSISLTRNALEQIKAFHHHFERETSNRLPAISLEERLVLTHVLGMTASHIQSFDEAATLFRLAQFANRDKSKLGLHARLSREPIASGLQREDLRTRDRLEDMRDRLMARATETLIQLVLPLRNYQHAEKNDYSSLVRLEDLEDKIATVDDHLLQSNIALSGDDLIELGQLQHVLKPNEALVVHVVAPGTGITTACVRSHDWTFNVVKFSKAEITQLAIDEKLLHAAVRATHQPSKQLDSTFPIDSSYRVYRSLFGGIEDCVKPKAHLLLATDPDLFLIPWNALITKASSTSDSFLLREASWFPRSHALSLIPSVRSFYQLRTVLQSRAARPFFGIGAPDFKGAPDQAPSIALGSLFAARGLADRNAIAKLPALPEAEDELRTVAAALDAPTSDILIGPEATERELRKRPLNDYRVVSFATHAIVPGELDGVGEPAIVLSLGTDAATHEQNDGLLTATEIANLSLDATLVILSACNTAAADGQPSGRGLSGLADAFFFAGARSIAVTQWSVFSQAAQRLGAGLVSQSTKMRRAGVSEGLRAAMLDYIGAAPEDYLAHPRFWASYLIAGDGDVRPLDFAERENPETVHTEWEHFAPPNSRDFEFMSVARATDGSFYALGIQAPPPGERVAGSYITKINSQRSKLEVIERRTDIAAANIISVGKQVATLGYIPIPAEDKSIATFRLLNDQGIEQLKYLQQSGRWNSAVTVFKVPKGYLLVSIEKEFSPGNKETKLRVSLLSEHGAVLTDRQHSVPLRATYFRAQGVALDDDGNILLAIPGDVPIPTSWQQKRWTNPVTGSQKFCVANTATMLLRIRPDNLEIISQRIIPDIRIVSVQRSDETFYAAASFSTNCHSEKRARLVSIDVNTLELAEIFHTNNVNGIEVTDFAVTKERFVLVGRILTLLPSAVTKDIMTPEQLNALSHPDPWDPSVWEQAEERASAFVLVVSREGTAIADRVFSDVRHRSLCCVVAAGPNRFLTVGNAFGDPGWAMIFTIHTPPPSVPPEKSH